MPRRKQDCPKRMKWDESHGECPKNGDGVRDASSLACQSSSRSMKEEDDDDDGDGDSRKEEDEDDEDNDVVVASAQIVVEASQKTTISPVAGGVDVVASDNVVVEQAEIDDRGTCNQSALVKLESRVVQDSDDSLVGPAHPFPPLDSGSSFPPLQRRPSASSPTLTQDSTTTAMSAAAAANTQLVPNNHNAEPSRTTTAAKDFEETFQQDDVVDDDDSEFSHCEPVNSCPIEASHRCDGQDGPLDFSVKRRLDSSPSPPHKDSDAALAAGVARTIDVPLDLSVPRKRASSSVAAESQMSAAHKHHHHRLKTPKPVSKSASSSSPWGGQFPFSFSPTTSPKNSVEVPLWNGSTFKGQSHQSHQRVSPAASPNDVVTQQPHHHHHQQTHGHHQNQHQHHHQHHQQTPHSYNRHGDLYPAVSTTSKSTYNTATASSAPSSSSNRHNAWQSQWLSRGAEQARDVLKCVWCRKSFSSLEEMTTHMKETKHCDVQQLHQQLPLSGVSSAPSSASASASVSSTAAAASRQAASTTSNDVEGVAPSSKEAAMPMPRKLVRGQDVWLGKGAEQTKQILKCMWCGQSFKSLAEMTTHMQQTQHYTNIISQEQIISWKSPEEKGCSAHSHVNAVLTCKVCDQAFSSLKELSNHMVKNSHYKEHILRSITENGGRRRQTREKRKKSLPVRKLLELERAQNEIKGKSASVSPSRSGSGSSPGVGSNGRITCEKCGQKIDTQSFVDHIRLCVGLCEAASVKHHAKSAASSATSSTSSEAPIMESVSPVSMGFAPHSPPPTAAAAKKDSCRNTPLTPPSPPEGTGFAIAAAAAAAVTSSNGRLASGTPSVLNAIEKLIEKSFDKKQRNRHQSYVRSSTSSPSPSLGRKSQSYDDEMTSSGRYAKAQLLLTTTSSPSATTTSATTTSGSSSKARSHMTQGLKRCFDSSSSPASSADADNDQRMRSSRKHPARDQHAHAVIKEEASDNSDSDDQDHLDGHLVKQDRISVESMLISKVSQISPLDSRSTTLHPPAPLSNCSPSPRVAESPGSCSDSSATGGGGGKKSRLLSFVRSTPSPISPASRSELHPLKELQKLLDKTNVSNSSKISVSTPPATTATSTTCSATAGGSRPTSSPSAISGLLAFNCICSDSNTLSAESVIKCTFCDTPFISKGTYRHHLAKVHSVKDDVTTTTTTMATSASTPTSLTLTTSTVTTTPCTSSTAAAASVSNGEGDAAKAGRADAPSATSDESPHSKFLKYTELAKQLSSKYV